MMRCSAMYMTDFASSGARPWLELNDFTMERASSGVSCTPFKRTIRLMASCQPSGVVRIQEMRVRFPFSSRRWHPLHLAMTSGSVTGMPG